MATTSFFEGITRPRAAMLVSLAANLAQTLVLAWALVFGHGGLPPLGAAGAALATSITRWLMFLVLAGYVLLMRDGERFGIREPLGGYYHLAGHLLFLGLPVALSVGFETTAFSGATVIAGWLAEDAARRLSALQNRHVLLLHADPGFGDGDRCARRQCGGLRQPRRYRARRLGGGRHGVRPHAAHRPWPPAAARPCGWDLHHGFTRCSPRPCRPWPRSPFSSSSTASRACSWERSAASPTWSCPPPATASRSGSSPRRFCYYLGYRQAAGPEGLIWGLTAGLAIATLLLGLRFAVVSRRNPMSYEKSEHDGLRHPHRRHATGCRTTRAAMCRPAKTEWAAAELWPVRRTALNPFLKIGPFYGFGMRSLKEVVSRLRRGGG